MWPPVTPFMAVIVWVCLMLPGVTAHFEQSKYVKVGDDIVLKAGHSAGTITSILWKISPELDTIAEWDQDTGEIHLYRQFKERGRLNISTGEFTITGLTRDESRYYTPEINKRTTLVTRLMVISPVSTPTISTVCDDEMSSCVLTCEGNTTDVGPVTYNWNYGEIRLEEGHKDLTITKNYEAEEFSCDMDNRISKESSQPIPNPFHAAARLKIIIGVTVFLCLLALALLLVLIHRWKTGMWFFQKGRKVN